MNNVHILNIIHLYIRLQWISIAVVKVQRINISTYTHVSDARFMIHSFTHEHVC